MNRNVHFQELFDYLEVSQGMFRYAPRPISTRTRKSNGGAIGLCVPPSIVNTDLSFARINAGSTVCSTSVELPAVPTEK